MSASTCCDGVGDGVSGVAVGGWVGDCAGVAAAAAPGSAGVAGVAVGSVGAAVLPEVPVGAGVAVAPVAAAGDGVALAAVALGSSPLGVGVELGVADPPLIAAANAVMCVRTSCSLVRADSSSVIDASGSALVVLGAVAVEPLVPTGAAAVAPVVLVLPSSSVRMRSAAATSVLQLAPPRPAAAPDAGCCDAARSRALKCRFSSATRVFDVPVSYAAGMSASADCA